MDPNLLAEKAKFFVVNSTRQQRSIIAYAESCAVDSGGLLDALRLNDEDLSHLTLLSQTHSASALWTFGPVPPDLLDGTLAYWVELNSLGWAVAGEVRRTRARQRGKRATAIFERVRQVRPQPRIRIEVKNPIDGSIGHLGLRFNANEKWEVVWFGGLLSDGREGAEFEEFAKAQEFAQREVAICVQEIQNDGNN